MSHLFGLQDADSNDIRHLLPMALGVARFEERRVPNGSIHFIRNGHCSRDGAADYGPLKSLCYRRVRWFHLGVIARILTKLAAQGDATDLKSLRAAPSREPTMTALPSDKPLHG